MSPTIDQRISLWPQALVSLLAMTTSGCITGGWADVSLDQTRTFGYSVEGRPIEGSIIGHGPETLLFIAVTHGNEPAGKPLLDRFRRYILERPELYRNRRLVIVPVVNPDGLARRSRSNARGIDLNRNFPSQNWTGSRKNGPKPASEPETKTVLRIIRQYGPERILSIHSPLHMVNYDGPARELAESLATASGYPVADSVGYPTPGSLGSYTGVDWKIPTITFELGPEVSTRNVWPRFRETLLRFLLYRNGQLASSLRETRRTER